jgi:hypothetical protein
MRRTKIAIAITTAAALTVTAATFAIARRRDLPAPAAASQTQAQAKAAPAAPLMPLKKTKGKVPIKFGGGNVVDVQRLGAEPEIKIDSQNNIYVTAPIGVQYAQSFLWKSEDGGNSYDLLRGAPFLQRPNPGAGSGDATIAFLPPANGGKTDAVVWSDMVNLAGLQNAATFDGGNTFPPEYWNEYATEPTADRQWLAAMKIPGTDTARVYQWYNQVAPDGLSVIYTDDYGKTWVEGMRGLDGGTPGNIAADPVNKKIYVTSSAGSNVIVGVGGVDANDFKNYTVAQGKGSVGNLFTVLDVDTAGNVYVTWTNGDEPRGTYMAVSTDQAKTWSDPIQVSPPSHKTTVFPWIVAGDPGRVWVVWYGSQKPEPAPANAGPWYAYAGQTLNALSKKPKFKVVKASDRVMHDNEICLSGIGCTAGQAEDRNLLDDFTADIDPQGMLWVSFNDTNSQVTAAQNDPEAGGAFIVNTKQISGPSLYKKVGNVAPPLPKPKVKKAKVKKGVLTLSGTHRMAPGNWVKDKAGDAGDPRHGPGCPCPNNALLDMKQAWLSQSKADDQSVLVNFRINNLPPVEEAVAAAGGKTPVYQVIFWIGENLYFAQFEATGPGRAYAGVPGPGVTNQTGVPKILDYTFNPARTEEVPFTYTPSEGKKPGAIEIAVPPSVFGDPKPKTKFDRTSFFVHTTAIGPAGETFMDQRDGTYSTIWKMGAKRKPSGKVQISIDDLRFKKPVKAKLVKYPKKGWAKKINVSKLRPGPHTVYVRSVSGPFKSKVLKGRFKI